MAIKLKYHKLHPEAPAPVYSTTDAACFDIFLCTNGKMAFKGYDESGKEFTRLLTTNGGILLCPKDRVLAPTGLIFDFAKDYSLRIHPRSGLSLKQGLTLANAEGVIDSVSYTHLTLPTKVRNNRVSFEEMKEKPTRDNTNRKGGFGSTGTKTLDNSSSNTI